MNMGQTVFAQLMDFVPRYEFRLCVERYGVTTRSRVFRVGISS